MGATMAPGQPLMDGCALPPRLDAGKIVEWDFSPSGPTRIGRGRAGRVRRSPVEHHAQASALPPPGPGSRPTGAGDRNIIPLYVIPNMRLIYNFIPHLKLRVSALRGLGRLRQRASPSRALWTSLPSPPASTSGQDARPAQSHRSARASMSSISQPRSSAGRPARNLPQAWRGAFAFAKYKNLEAWCAVAIELDVAHETGAVRLRRAVSAVGFRPGGQSRAA